MASVGQRLPEEAVPGHLESKNGRLAMEAVLQSLPGVVVGVASAALLRPRCHVLGLDVGGGVAAAERALGVERRQGGGPFDLWLLPTTSCLPLPRSSSSSFSSPADFPGKVGVVAKLPKQVLDALPARAVDVREVPGTLIRRGTRPTAGIGAMRPPALVGVWLRELTAKAALEFLQDGGQEGLAQRGTGVRDKLLPLLHHTRTRGGGSHDWYNRDSEPTTL